MITNQNGFFQGLLDKKNFQEKKVLTAKMNDETKNNQSVDKGRLCLPGLGITKRLKGTELRTKIVFSVPSHGSNFSTMHPQSG